MAKNKGVTETVSTEPEMDDEDCVYDPRKIPGLEDVELLDEQLGFAPYVEARPGLRFMAIPVHFDMDPDREVLDAKGNPRQPFDRWVFQAVHPIMAARGPKGDEQTRTKVLPGEFFSTTYYKQLRLNMYLGLPVELTCHEKIQMADCKKTMWTWTMRVSPDTKLKLAAKRAEIVAQMSAAHATPPRQVANATS